MNFVSYKFSRLGLALASAVLFASVGCSTAVTTETLTPPPVTPPPVTPPPVTPPPVTPPPVTPPPVTPPPVTPPPVTPPPVTPPPTGAGIGFNGVAMAGSQPLTGADVQLYAAGTTGNGSQPTALLTTTSVTDSTGSFALPAGYTCNTGDQVYLVVRGGQLANSSVNSAIALMSALGPCNSILSATSYTVNEVTTAASVWALAQFLAPGGNLGATSTNGQGIANAAATATALANPATGTSPGTNLPQSATSPANRINTLANLLNTCTSASSSAPCATLFAAATPSGATAPADTLDAALSIVRHPGSNTATLYTLAQQSTAFAPVLTTAPADWTLFLNYSDATTISFPTGVGIDSTGNVWVASYAGMATELSPTGSTLFTSALGAGALMHPEGLAIDASDNVWIPNDGSSGFNGGYGSVTELSATGKVLSPVASGFLAGGLSYPLAAAVDTNSTEWFVNYGNSSVTLLSSTGAAISGANGYSSSKLIFPVALALDASHNAWVANYADETITKVSPDGTQFTSYNCCEAPAGVAIDQNGYVWVANYLGNSVSELASDGTVISDGYSDGEVSINHPQGITIDGAGNVWVANYRGISLTELAGSSASSPGTILSPTVGYVSDADLEEAFSLAIDASGNIWVTNFGSSVLTQVIGLAAPVRTPQLGPPQAP